MPHRIRLLARAVVPALTAAFLCALLLLTAKMLPHPPSPSPAPDRPAPVRPSIQHPEPRLSPPPFGIDPRPMLLYRQRDLAPDPVHIDLELLERKLSR